jgi:glycine cleavage system aminomethyltransferase T
MQLAEGWMTLKRTPLYDTHVALGARVVEFGGWEPLYRREGR